MASRPFDFSPTELELKSSEVLHRPSDRSLFSTANISGRRLKTKFGNTSFATSTVKSINSRRVIFMLLIYQLDNFFQVPNVVGNALFHRCACDSVCWAVRRDAGQCARDARAPLRIPASAGAPAVALQALARHAGAASRSAEWRVRSQNLGVRSWNWAGVSRGTRFRRR
jgi:hypothetical protein